MEQQIEQQKAQQVEQQKAQKRFRPDKKHIQGFIAGVLVSAIVLTGLLAGLNPGFLTGTVWDSDNIICDITYGNVTIKNAGNYGCRISYYVSEGTEEIEYTYSSSKITVKGSTSKYAIIVENNAEIDITLDGVSIIKPSKSPIKLGEHTHVKLFLENENELHGRMISPAISVENVGSLEIYGPGSLTAIGGTNAPGIGSLWEAHDYYGVINIYSGTINATGGEYLGSRGGAGIGGWSYQNDFGQINIYGGTVNATGGAEANGLGRGYGGESADYSSINISDGTVVAKGGKGAKGIYNPTDITYGSNVTIIDG